jgi:hypothetical protein
MFAKRMLLAAVLVAATLSNVLAKHNPKYRGTDKNPFLMCEGRSMFVPSIKHTSITQIACIPLSVPGWQKVRSFTLCLNGTFEDPISAVVYADTIPVVNCQQVSRPLDQLAQLIIMRSCHRASGVGGDQGEWGTKVA